MEGQRGGGHSTAGRPTLRSPLSADSTLLPVNSQDPKFSPMWPPTVLKVLSHIVYYANCPKSLEGAPKSLVQLSYPVVVEALIFPSVPDLWKKEASYTLPLLHALQPSSHTDWSCLL